MRVLITGGCKNGKSTFAEKIAERQRPDGGKLYYLATMIPKDNEDTKRIDIHRAARAEGGYETLEIPWDITRVLDSCGENASFLFDSLTALLENEMFGRVGGFVKDAGPKVLSEVLELLGKTENMVIVSDYICEDTGRYDEWTERFREALASIERRAAEICDVVIESVYGSMVFHKGWEKVLPEFHESCSERSCADMTLVTGGVYQGKLKYVLSELKKDARVFSCDENSADVDFDCDVIDRFHMLVLALMRRGDDPFTFIEENIKRLSSKIIICDDISCGVVPVDAETRLWREAVGRCMVLLSGYADSVIRVFCGIPAVLKQREQPKGQTAL